MYAIAFSMSNSRASPARFAANFISYKDEQDCTAKWLKVQAFSLNFANLATGIRDVEVGEVPRPLRGPGPHVRASSWACIGRNNPRAMKGGVTLKTGAGVSVGWIHAYLMSCVQIQATGFSRKARKHFPRG